MKLYLIVCKKCSRGWWVSKEVAQRFNKQFKSLCPICRKKKRRYRP